MHVPFLRVCVFGCTYLEVEEALYGEEAEGEDNVPNGTGSSTDVRDR